MYRRLRPLTVVFLLCLLWVQLSHAASLTRVVPPPLPKPNPGETPAQGAGAEKSTGVSVSASDRSQEKTPPPPKLSAAAAVLMDAESGLVLWGSQRTRTSGSGQSDEDCHRIGGGRKG